MNADPKRYRLMRTTKEFVWLRWEAFGVSRRGLSIKVNSADFRKEWIPFPIHDSLIEPQRYIRLSRYQRPNAKADQQRAEKE